MKQHWILFYHESTFEYYLWNGKYPIGITPNGKSWCDINDIKVTEDELKAITSVIGTRKQSFKIKNRGTFRVAKKGSFITE